MAVALAGDANAVGLVGASNTTPVNATVFGKTIPLLFGSTKILGAPLWATPVVTLPNNTRRVTFAAVFGKRSPLAVDVKLSKLWINDTLVYDPQSNVQDYDFQFFDGSENQQPSSDILAQEGKANTPAFRDRIYVVIRNVFIPVGGNFPQVTALIDQVAQTGQKRYVFPYQTYQAGQSLVTELNLCLSANMLMTVDNAKKFSVYDIQHGVRTNVAPMQELVQSGQAEYSSGALSYDGVFYFYGVGSGFEFAQMRAVNPRTGQIFGRVGYTDGSSGSAGNTNDSYVLYAHAIDTARYMLQGQYVVATLGAYGDLQLFTYAAGTFKQLGIFRDTGFSITDNGRMVRVSPREPVSEQVVFGFCNNGTTIVQFTHVLTPGALLLQENEDGIVAFAGDAGYSATGNIGTTRRTGNYQVTAQGGRLVVFDLTQHLVAGGTNERINNIWVSEDGKYLCATTQFLQGGTTHTRFMKFQTIIGSAYTITLSPYLDPASTPHHISYIQSSDLGGSAADYNKYSQLVSLIDVLIDDGLFDANSLRQVPPGQKSVVYQTAGDAGFTVLNLNDGTFKSYPKGDYYQQDGVTPYTGTFGGLNSVTIYDELARRFYYASAVPDLPGFIQIVLGGAGDSHFIMPLPTYLTEIGVLAGFDADDIVTTNLDTVVLVGSIINVQVNFLDLMRQIADLFRIDIVESDGKLKFNGPSAGDQFAPVLTLTEADLAPVTQNSTDDGTLIDKVRDDTKLLPTVLNVDYLDSNNSFAVGAQSAKRTQFPARTSSGLSIPKISVPLAMDAATALYWVNFALFDQWAGALTLTMLTSRKLLALEPGDYVAINTVADGSYIAKIISTALNQDWSISLTASTVITKIPAKASTTPPVISAPDGQVPVPADYKVAIIDDAMFRDLETDLAVVTVFSEVATTTLLTPPNGKYTLINCAGGARFGTIVNDHPATANYEAHDRTNVLKVFFRNNVVAPVTSDTGINQYAVIGAPGRWEYIYFDTCVLNTDGSYTISGVVRGRGGTDVFMDQQQAGDTFILLTGAYTGTGLIDPTGQPFAVSSVTTARGSSQPAREGSFTFSGGTLRPWAPVAVTAVRSGGNVVFNWQRRDREDSDLIDDGADTAPMSEATEAYDLEILAPDGTVLRTVSALTAPTWTYTASYIATDGQTNANVMRVKVYQLSAVVGRGLSRVAACPLT